MDSKQINKLKVTELKDELKKLGLSASGVKAVLAKRLKEALNVSVDELDTSSLSQASANDSIEFVSSAPGLQEQNIAAQYLKPVGMVQSNQNVMTSQLIDVPQITPIQQPVYIPQLLPQMNDTHIPHLSPSSQHTLSVSLASPTKSLVVHHSPCIVEPSQPVCQTSVPCVLTLPIVQQEMSQSCIQTDDPPSNSQSQVLTSQPDDDLESLTVSQVIQPQQSNEEQLLPVEKSIPEQSAQLTLEIAPQNLPEIISSQTSPLKVAPVVSTAVVSPLTSPNYVAPLASPVKDAHLTTPEPVEVVSTISTIDETMEPVQQLTEDLLPVEASDLPLIQQLPTLPSSICPEVDTNQNKDSPDKNVEMSSVENIQEPLIDETSNTILHSMEVGFSCQEELPIKSEVIESSVTHSRREERKRRHSRSRSPRKRSRSRSNDRKSRSPSRSRSPRYTRQDSVLAGEEPRGWDLRTDVCLDWFNSDLNFCIESCGLKGRPITLDGFNLMWAGARATFGIHKGKIFFEVRILEDIKVELGPEGGIPNVARIGWSVDASDFALGEEPNSFGYGGTGKKSVNSQFVDYGKKFGENDVIGAYCEATDEEFILSFTLNGEKQGECYRVTHASVDQGALFPHIYVKNVAIEVNFSSDAWFPSGPNSEGWKMIGDLSFNERVRGLKPPQVKEDCDMLMMCGLPGCGKTYWADQYAKSCPEKRFSVLGTNLILDKMKVMGIGRKRNYAGRWEVLIEKSTKCLNKLIELSAKRRRNYILDQTNVYVSAQRRKMRPFEGFRRKAVVIVPTDEEFLRRIDQRTKEEGKEVPESAVLEMKANFKIPEEGDLFDEIIFPELKRPLAEELVRKYNQDGGAVTRPQWKRSRFDSDDSFRGRGDLRHDSNKSSDDRSYNRDRSHGRDRDIKDDRGFRSGGGYRSERSGGSRFDSDSGFRRGGFSDRGERRGGFYERGGDRRGGFSDRGGDRRGSFTDRGGDRRGAFNDRGDRKGGFNDRRGGFSDRGGDRRGGFSDGGFRDRGSFRGGDRGGFRGGDRGFRGGGFRGDRGDGQRSGSYGNQQSRGGYHDNQQRDGANRQQFTFQQQPTFQNPTNQQISFSGQQQPTYGGQQQPTFDGQQKPTYMGQQQTTYGHQQQHQPQSYGGHQQPSFSRFATNQQQQGNFGQAAVKDESLSAALQYNQQHFNQFSNTGYNQGYK